MASTGPLIEVVTPTYNEKNNLETLVHKIFALRIAGLALTVVDDNSPDGTGQLADALAKVYPIQVIHRQQKSGLGTAYVEAFQSILQKKPDYIIQLDADLSHDPRDIPRLLEEIEQCDLVLGSRYIPGGNIRNWSLSRRLISRFGNLYANAVLFIPFRDLTGGFKCYRREVLEQIGLDTLSSVGYNFQIETTYRAYKKGFRIREMPIIFTERTAGSTKFDFNIIWESFVKILNVRFRGK